MDLACKKFLQGHCWSFVTKLNPHELRKALFGHVDMATNPSLEFVRPVLDRILSNCASVRSWILVGSRASKVAELLGTIEDKVAPQLTYASVAALPGIVRLRIPASIHLDAVTSVKFGQIAPAIPVDETISSMQPFRKLKRLRVMAPSSSIPHILEQFAANKHPIEKLTITAGLTEIEPECTELAIEAISKFAKANQETLKELKIQKTGNSGYFSPTWMNEEFDPAGDWMALEARVKEEFAVPMRKLQIGSGSLWTMFTERFEGDIGKFKPLFDMCYDSGRSLKTAKALQHVVSAVNNPYQSYQFVFDTVVNLISPSWSWSPSQLQILDIIVLVLHRMLQPTSFHREAAAVCLKESVPYLAKITEAMRDIIDQYPDSLLSIKHKSVLTALVNSDPSWTKKIPPQFIQLLLGLAQDLELDDYLLQVAFQCQPDMACSIATLLLPYLDLAIDKRVLEPSIAYQYLELLRQYPQHLPKLLEKPRCLDKYFESSLRLVRLMAALVMDEQVLSQVLVTHRAKIGNTVRDFTEFTKHTLNHIRDSLPILSSEEKQLVIFHFWRAHLNGISTEKGARLVLGKLREAFDVLPDRIKAWVCSTDSPEDIKMHERIDIQSFKKSVREMWNIQGM